MLACSASCICSVLYVLSTAAARAREGEVCVRRARGAFGLIPRAAWAIGGQPHAPTAQGQDTCERETTPRGARLLALGARLRSAAWLAARRTAV